MSSGGDHSWGAPTKQAFYFCILGLGPNVFCSQLIHECGNCLGQSGNSFMVCIGGSGQVGHVSDKSATSRELAMRIMFCYICSMTSCAASRVGDDTLLSLSSCKFPSESPLSLIHRSAALPFSTGPRDCTCVQGKQESNVNILCLHVWLYSGIGIPDSILNRLGQSISLSPCYPGPDLPPTYLHMSVPTQLRHATECQIVLAQLVIDPCLHFVSSQICITIINS
jgi:hypothetical protein